MFEGLYQYLKKFEKSLKLKFLVILYAIYESYVKKSKFEKYNNLLSSELFMIHNYEFVTDPKKTNLYRDYFT